MFESMLEGLYNGDLSVVNYMAINHRILQIFKKTNHLKEDIKDMADILEISNILYNNTDLVLLPLEDGIYDLLLELYRRYNANVQIGAKVIHFEPTNQSVVNRSMLNPVKYFDPNEENLFNEALQNQKIYINDKDSLHSPITYMVAPDNSLNRRTKTSTQEYPELVGTLEKAKFTLISQAEEKGVANDPKVVIFERDFFGKHLSSSIIDPNTRYKMVAELKYDGLSVAETVSSKIYDAYSRGDTDDSLATDLYPILKDYIYPDALMHIRDDDKFGLKCEAIMTYNDLAIYSERRGKRYANPRNTIIGLFSSSDAYKHIDLITLVPLATSLNIDRLSEIEFMNTYYTTKEKLRYAVLEGTYLELLYLVKRFVDEAEAMRAFMPFMYDGVVISYVDEEVIQKLGRANSTNKYSMAIKFNTLKKQTILRAVSFTVGQNGLITPMLKYDPVEFYGNAQSKSSAHSRERFISLGLRINHMIDLEYVGDVMTYVTRPDCEFNDANQNPLLEFITICPICGSDLRVSDTGKSSFCDNFNCPGRRKAKMVSMVSKLNLKDFAEANLVEIARETLKDMINITMEDLNETSLGEVMSLKFLARMEDLKTRSIDDYQIIGSLGFTDIGRSLWKVILNIYTLSEVLQMYSDGLLYNNLMGIKGIGKSIAGTIIEEIPYFIEDLRYIETMPNVNKTKGVSKLVIRFTGVRDSELVEGLKAKGYDIDGNAGVTKKTNILLVPSSSHTSTKIDTAIGYGVKIIPLHEFKENMGLYI